MSPTQPPPQSPPRTPPRTHAAPPPPASSASPTSPSSAMHPDASLSLAARMRQMMTRAVSFDNVTAFAATPLASPFAGAGAGGAGAGGVFAAGVDAAGVPLSPVAAAAAGVAAAPAASSPAMDNAFPEPESPRPGKFAKKRLAIVMVGLPARGKTHIARCLERYLNWLGFNSSVWNVGHYRRMRLGGSQPADFFDPKNETGARARMELAQECLHDMLRWFEEGGIVGIYDATNSTVARRRMVREKLEAAAVRVLFLESICTDESIVAKNISETKMRSPDYRYADPEDAVRDFTARINTYVSASETVTDAERCSYIKIINVGKQIILNDIKGFVQAKIVSFLLNTHITTRSIYLSRHGESEWNVSGKLGGDPSLTARGRIYARKLAEFIQAEVAEDAATVSTASNASDEGSDGVDTGGARGDGAAAGHGAEVDPPMPGSVASRGRLPAVWTSQLQRTRQTVEHIPTMNLCWRALNEIDAGICEGLTYAEVAEKYPDVAAARKEDKLRYRYPGGESYVDVIYRLEPVILELERQKGPVLIVAHNAVIRSIYAYFTGKRQDECPNLDIPLHTVFKLTTTAYGAVEQRYPLNVENTYANKTPETTNSSTEDVPGLAEQLAGASVS